MNINQAFPSKYIKASDLNGRSINVTISDVKVEQVGQSRDTKPVVYFEGKEKGLVLNKTNSGKIATIAGSQETDDWVGVTVLIYPSETEYQGETVECVRVKPSQQAQRPETRQAAPPPPEPEAPAVTEDDIPFSWVLPLMLPLAGLLSAVSQVA